MNADNNIHLREYGEKKKGAPPHPPPQKILQKLYYWLLKTLSSNLKNSNLDRFEQEKNGTRQSSPDSEESTWGSN